MVIRRTTRYFKRFDWTRLVLIDIVDSRDRARAEGGEDGGNIPPPTGSAPTLDNMTV